MSFLATNLLLFCHIRQWNGRCKNNSYLFKYTSIYYLFIFYYTIEAILHILRFLEALIVDNPFNDMSLVLLDRYVELYNLLLSCWWWSQGSKDPILKDKKCITIVTCLSVFFFFHFEKIDIFYYIFFNIIQ